MNKPSLEDVIRIYRLKEQVADAYAEIDRTLIILLAQYGEGQFDYDLVESLKEGRFDSARISHIGQLIKDGGNYLRLELKDNLKVLASGEPVYTMTSVKPVHYGIRSLKRQPKSLQEDEG